MLEVSRGRALHWIPYVYIVSHRGFDIAHGLYDGSVALLDRSIKSDKAFFGALI
jgi:hypothetical protein